MFELTRRIWGRLKRIIFRLLHAWRMGSCGKNVLIDWPFRLDGTQFMSINENSLIQKRAWLYCNPIDEMSCELKIGARCNFGYNNHIVSVKEVVIADDVLTANNVFISVSLHTYDDIEVPIMYQPIKFKRSVGIGSGTWIGENACIIGAHIGKNCVIGANSVVTEDVPDYSVAVGAPAQVIKYFDQVSKTWVMKKKK